MKKKTLSFIISCSLLGLAAAISVVSATAMQVEAIKHTPSEFRIIDKYCYRASTRFEETVDTMEAWVNIPSNSLGGMIMSTYSGYDSQYEGFNIEVDALGRVKYVYNDDSFNYTFENSNLMDGKWHHIALVRDDINYNLSLYIDGEINEVNPIKLPDSFPKKQLYIGVNPCYWNTKSKKPLEGSIKQITIYTGPISQERVKQDMNNNEISSDAEHAKLLANWDFGEKWTKRFVKDNSGNHNDAQLQTYEKYVGVAPVDDFDYSILVLPDIQCMNRYKHERFAKLIDWIIANVDTLKAKFLLQVGDLSDYGPEEEYYRTSSLEMSRLNGVIPWSFVPGNHDYDDNCNNSRSTTYLNKYYPYSVHSKLPGFGGAYEVGKMENTYYLHDVGDIKYCVINLEYGPRMDVLRWANRICEKYNDRRIIVQTHAYVDPAGFWTINKGAAVAGWRNVVEATTPAQFHDYLVKKQKNMFLAIGGHYGSDDIVYVPNTGEQGNKIHSFLIDNQASVYNKEGIGQDAVAIFKVNERKKTISTSYYCPHYDAVYNIQNQFDFYFGDANNPTVGL